jgi:tRNA(Arg) A34 adenosine deaminase TadA
MKINNHEEAMRLAIQSALEGVQADEGGPFGACVVKNNQVISVAHNTVLKDNDPTCHAEMNAIRQAAKALGTYDLSDCEIYSNVEPCPMCLTAIYWARIKGIYAAAHQPLAARYGFDDQVFFKEVRKSVEERSIPCQTGILTAECEAVFEEWLKLKRRLY